MALLTVLEYPDKRLRNTALPVTDVDVSIRTLVENMFETMYAETAVGLAATQVNIQQRIIVMDVSDDRRSPLCLINPEILHREGIQYEFEGCISFPGVYDKVERAAKLRVRALDQYGKLIEMDAEELLAVCIQHEMDHLDGVLFIDHLSRLKQQRLCKKLEKSRSHST
jgi:peptide deformylase